MKQKSTPQPEVTYPEVAKAMGYRSITVPYLECERWMLENALHDFQASGRKYLIVAVGDGHEIWVPKSELL